MVNTNQVPSLLPGAGELGVPALNSWVLLQILEGEKAKTKASVQHKEDI